LVDSLEHAFEAKQFEPFIRSLWFPHYKNFLPGARIDFNFPVTVVTGQNGTNKSSILKTLYGCCQDQSLGDLWFSSATDTIVDPEGGSTRFVYTFYSEEFRIDAEVLQNHRRRIRKGVKDEPDYWETSRPSKKDGMRDGRKEVKDLTGNERWEKIEKACTLIDFRSELSAFDRYFYHLPFKAGKRFANKKEFIRFRSEIIQRALQAGTDFHRNYGGHGGNWDVKYRALTATLTQQINHILGKQYDSIIVLQHNLFGFAGSTVSIRLGDGTNYTEAFAGSGEFAVIMLVVKLHDVGERTLVLMDEPEMSLHPGAQKALLNHICQVTLTKKLQVVISTHSPAIVEELPRAAVRTLFDSAGKIDVLQDCDPGQAFFYIAPTQVQTRNLYFEDRLALEITRYAARTVRNDAYAQQFSYHFLPGGHTAIKGTFIVAASRSNSQASFYLLDGDQRPTAPHLDPDEIPLASNSRLGHLIQGQTGQEIKFPRDSGGAGQAAFIETQRTYLAFYQHHVYYLPQMTPEELLIRNSIADDVASHHDAPDFKVALHDIALSRMGNAAAGAVTGDEIFITAKQILGQLPADNADFQAIVGILDTVLRQPV